MPLYIALPLNYTYLRIPYPRNVQEPKKQKKMVLVLFPNAINATTLHLLHLPWISFQEVSKNLKNKKERF